MLASAGGGFTGVCDYSIVVVNGVNESPRGDAGFIQCAVSSVRLKIVVVVCAHVTPGAPSTRTAATTSAQGSGTTLTRLPHPRRVPGHPTPPGSTWYYNGRDKRGLCAPGQCGLPAAVNASQLV